MNIRGIPEGNWQWRLLPGEANSELAQKIYDMTVMYSRTAQRAKTEPDVE